MSNETHINFNIKITIFTHETLRLWGYEIDNKMLKITQFSTSGRGEKVVLEKKLSQNESNKIYNFLKKMPLTQLEEYYSHETVTGNSSAQFLLEIGSVKKEIKIYYKKEENLFNLTKLLDTFIPHEYRLRHQLWFFVR